MATALWRALYMLLSPNDSQSFSHHVGLFNGACRDRGWPRLSCSVTLCRRWWHIIVDTWLKGLFKCPVCPRSWIHILMCSSLSWKTHLLFTSSHSTCCHLFLPPSSIIFLFLLCQTHMQSLLTLSALLRAFPTPKWNSLRLCCSTALSCHYR